MKKTEEFRRGWLQLLASTMGLAVGVIGLGTYNLGLFAASLNKAMGLTRTQFGVGYALFAFSLSLGLPLWGRLVARFGVSKAAAASALCMALCFAGLGTISYNPGMYFLFLAGVGLAGGATSGLTFTHTVSSWFDRARGFALGLTQVGLGASGAMVPPLVARIIGKYGWQSGYLALACIAAVGAPLALMILRDHPPEVAARPPLKDAKSQAQENLLYARAIRSRPFWTMIFGFSLITLFVGGTAVHESRMLQEFGATPIQAAGYVSLVAMGTISVRVIFGWLSDHFQAAWLVAISSMIGAAGIAALGIGGIHFAPLFAFSLGWAFGGEIDLVAYMTSRYFDLRIFSRVYPFQYGAICAVAGVSPFMVGWIADANQSYRPGLFVCALIGVLASLVFWTLPRYGIDAGRHDAPECELDKLYKSTGA